MFCSLFRSIGQATHCQGLFNTLCLFANTEERLQESHALLQSEPPTLDSSVVSTHHTSLPGE